MPTNSLVQERVAHGRAGGLARAGRRRPVGTRRRARSAIGLAAALAVGGAGTAATAASSAFATAPAPAPPPVPVVTTVVVRTAGGTVGAGAASATDRAGAPVPSQPSGSRGAGSATRTAAAGQAAVEVLPGPLEVAGPLTLRAVRARGGALALIASGSVTVLDATGSGRGWILSVAARVPGSARGWVLAVDPRLPPRCLAGSSCVLPGPKRPRHVRVPLDGTPSVLLDAAPGSGVGAVELPGLTWRLEGPRGAGVPLPRDLAGLTVTLSVQPAGA